MSVPKLPRRPNPLKQQISLKVSASCLESKVKNSLHNAGIGVVPANVGSREMTTDIYFFTPCPFPPSMLWIDLPNGNAFNCRDFTVTGSAWKMMKRNGPLEWILGVQATFWPTPDSTEFMLDMTGDLRDHMLYGKSSINKFFWMNFFAGQAVETFEVPSSVLTAWLKRWDGHKFLTISLKSLGLKLQLNHASSFCENPIPVHTNMLILHTNSIHDVTICYCGCPCALPPNIQLLRRQLYPASHIKIKTCASFQLLEHLHKFALTMKASTYDFYWALEKLTTNTGMGVPKSCYKPLFQMILQWHHLKMLKWAGRANDPTGVDGMKTGELAIQCPSCPHPGINLPEDWVNMPEKLKSRITGLPKMMKFGSGHAKILKKSPGTGFWSPNLLTNPSKMSKFGNMTKQKSGLYVLSRASDEDISTCVGFQALAKANSKFSVGLRYTGVSAVVCGHSEMIFPLGVGNLQKGECYANMDYIFGSVLQYVLVLLVLISYDIACQWFTNLFSCIDNHWPNSIKPRPNTTLVPTIPKLYEPMHEQKDHQVYSLNLIKGVSFSNCECPERVWAPHNALSNSTKTQGPGSHQDILDDHFGFWNWLKYIGLGSTLLRQYKAVVAQRNLQQEGHCGLTASLDSDLVQKWETMCQDWEADSFPRKAVNPYHLDDAYMSKAQIKKELAEEEECRIAEGGVSLHETLAAGFIQMGLDLEEAQCHLKRLNATIASKISTTLGDEQSITEEHNSLRIQLRAWEKLLPIYIPGLLQYETNLSRSSATSQKGEKGSDKLQDTLEGSSSNKPEDAVLWLPSRIPALIHSQARNAADRYRASRAAKLELAGPDPNHLHPKAGCPGTLEDNRAAGPSTAPNTRDNQEFELFNEVWTRHDGTGETRRTLSWIWLTIPSNDSEEDKDDILRVEWAKSRARATRATEEVMLLKEEMRWVLAFLEWKSRWWQDRQCTRTGLEKSMVEGVQAFALRQSSLQSQLAAHFHKLWKAPLEDSEKEASNDSHTTPASQKDTGDDNDDNDDDDDDDADEQLEGGLDNDWDDNILEEEED
ncbi:hypothetical protein CPB84DRAFT_1744643 [Gymnopilus junonius]|uniref:CxC2-like cysteine cluster KDZ transposase-associated domain-containing protein n=1 Tax=Gymnopilus junonius TaxID=109634 RepID=A0A9P5NSL3_GYMJU|nr:hypothetical protein CPB84DRAFT_1744643 [Gymnopilus junonius]